MRSADIGRGLVALALVLGASGCSTVGDGVSAMRGAVSSAGGSGKNAASTAPAAPVRPAPPVYATPVNPAA
jgi:hypothetical protein